MLSEGVTPLVDEDFHVNVITEPDEQIALLAGLDELVALDWEWNIADPSSVDGLSVATRTDTYYLPCRASDYCVPDGHGLRLRNAFADVLKRGVPSVFHGGRADLGKVYPGDPVELVGLPIHDTLIMAYLADPYADDLGLKPLTRGRLHREPLDFPGVLSEIPLARGARYAGADARNTFDLFKSLVPELIAKEQWTVYTEFEQPLMPLVASMEAGGQPVDVPLLIQYAREHVLIEKALDEAFLDTYGVDVADKTDGRAKTKDWLKTVVGTRPGKLDQRALSKYPHGEVDLLLYRNKNHTELTNFLGRSLLRWTDLGKPELFKLYPNFNQAGKDNADGTIGRAARSGRFTSSGSNKKEDRAFGSPNFQNQPRTIRDLFIAPPGHRFWSFDYAALELRIAAAVSGDPVMLAALNGGDDLHGIFRTRVLELTGVDVGRPAAKAGNFEQLYGGGPAMLVRILRKQRAFISLDVAQAIVTGHELTFPTYHDWAREQVKIAKAKGYAETLFGRRRYLPDLYSRDPEKRSHAERAAVNHVIQGTAADIVKLAMIRLVPVMGKWGGHIAIQVHDEVDGWLPEGCDEQMFCSEVTNVMESIELPGIRLKVEGGVAATWGGAH